MKPSTGILLFSAIFISWQSIAQDPVDDPTELLGQTKAITTAVPFLLISPDARHAALGDAGVASSPDANASFWNAGKLVFIDKAYGGSVSYTPWLGKIINDMSISYLTGFYKISQEQAASFSLKYFDLGDITFTDTNGDVTGVYNPREFAFDFTYSRKLTEELGVGIAARYIHSNLTGAFAAGSDARPGSSAAADIGIYYIKALQSARNSNFSLGASITNIGAKISYSDNANKDFLPTNLRLGGSFTTELDQYNSLTFLADLNKLMVPTIDEDQTLLSGMFGSFGDAPGGFSEEIKEFIISTGVEYWYNQIFAARLGYFNEAFEKGNRKYLTAGAGFRKKNFGFDIAYLVPTNKREHPLSETLRFTLLLQVGEKIQDLDKTVTD